MEYSLTTSILFYFICVILPIFTMLYSLGNIVFAIGEFKSNLDKVPRILLLMLSKSISMVGMLFISLHYLFDQEHELTVGICLITISLGLYIFFESITSNKLISRYVKFVDKIHPATFQFAKYVKINTRQIFICNKLVFLIASFFATFLFTVMLVVLVTNFNFFVLTLLSTFCILMFVKSLIMNLIKHL